MIWDTVFGGARKPQKARGAVRLGTSDHDLSTHLGRVMDISSTGLRLRGEKKPIVQPGESIAICVTNGSQSIRVGGVVAWVRRRSGAYEVGLRFAGTSEGAIAGLIQFARHGFVNTIPGGASSATTSSEPLSARVEVEDLYEVLGVARNASEAEIRAAYHRLAREAHPDSGGEAASPERFARISKSYSVLRDTALRARYDALLSGAA